MPTRQGHRAYVNRMVQKHQKTISDTSRHFFGVVAGLPIGARHERLVQRMRLNAQKLERNPKDKEAIFENRHIRKFLTWITHS